MTKILKFLESFDVLSELNKDLSTIQDITEEEMSFIEDIFYDLVDSGDVEDIIADTYNESRDSSGSLINIVKNLDMTNLYQKLDDIDKSSNWELIAPFLRKIKMNIISVQIRVRSIKETHEKINPFIKRVEQLTNMSYLTRHQSISGVNTNRHSIFFMKNKSDLERICKKTNFITQ